MSPQTVLSPHESAVQNRIINFLIYSTLTLVWAAGFFLYFRFYVGKSAPMALALSGIHFATVIACYFVLHGLVFVWRRTRRWQKSRKANHP